jgi:hypothetical protein
LFLLAYGGSLVPPHDIPPYIFPQDDVPVSPWLVPHATTLVASSLGGTVVPLSSLLHADAPLSLDSNLTVLFPQATVYGGHFSPMAPPPQHPPSVPAPTLPAVAPVIPGRFLSGVPTFPGGLPVVAPVFPGVLPGGAAIILGGLPLALPTSPAVVPPPLVAPLAPTILERFPPALPPY